MRAKIVGLSNSKEFDDEKDPASLLREIKAVSYEYKGRRNHYLALDEAKTKIYKYYQKSFESKTLHYNTFIALVEVVEHHEGTLYRDETLTEVEDKKIDEDFNLTGESPESRASIETIAHDKALAVAFLSRSNRGRYGYLLDNLENQFSLIDTNQYHIDLPSVLTTLDCYVKPTPSPQPHRLLPLHNDIDDVDMTFVQIGPLVSGTDDVTHEGVACLGCNTKGNYRDKCPDVYLQLAQLGGEATAHVATEDVSNFDLTEYSDGETDSVPVEDAHLSVADEDVFIDFSFLQMNTPPPPSRRKISLTHNITNANVRIKLTKSTTTTPPKPKLIASHLLLLDSEFTVCVFNDPSFVMNIRPQTDGRFIDVHINGGTQISFLIGDTKYFGTVWYNPDSIANILSLSRVSSMYRLTMDSFISHTMHVHLLNHTTMTLNETPNGLYCHDTRQNGNKASKNVNHYSF